jgi:hypothetical protein
MQFIDIDTDTNTFSWFTTASSNHLFQDCLCWLYWGALIKGSDSRATITSKIEITG